MIASLFATLLLILGACADANNDNASKDNTDDMQDIDHSNMEMNEEAPKDMKEAKNPTYKIGSSVMNKANHMKGMKGAKATIVGAYDTTVYTVTYTPTIGGKRMKNYKWVVQEEIKEAGDKPFESGTEVTLEANHMKGMKGATATIDTDERTTVYMVDYQPTTGGKEVKNHMWVTESELSATD
ncbi:MULTISPECIES: YdhK family protein [Bacillus]|uniref:DUF1541 domain-containing protein n=1 Tax=Bacillus glycinifermentans TaxID=1664069 RepID=A0AAJ4D367_9BACI|nr:MULTISPECIES: YdhK family protein [Bacillus]KKB73061.1 hypothetical protein TH62_14615 [Bacillus sp. TH008]MDU0070745.1 YdhK family protein [Bacillus sp. IG6]MED8018683.1 YdhK family protein [Bacillus glycinifermentans]QAT66165.1 DUF1541 domain-containing protein [Bacillus glycinifermentans]WKB75875.1 YdhK family protein [Bacillus glycinifermentans]